MAVGKHTLSLLGSEDPPGPEECSFPHFQRVVMSPHVCRLTYWEGRCSSTGLLWIEGTHVNDCSFKEESVFFYGCLSWWSLIG